MAATSPTLATPPALAAPDRQERVEREVAEAEAAMEHATERARRAAVRLVETEAALPVVRARLAKARGEATAAAVRARSAGREAERAEAALASAGARLERSERALEQARERVAGFAVAAYQGSVLARARLMLRAETPAEVVTRLGYLDHLSGLEQEAVDALVANRQRAQRAEREADAAHRRAESARRAAVEALTRARTAEAEAEDAAVEVGELAAAREEALADAEAERADTLRRYEQAEDTSEQVGDQLRRAGPDDRAAGSSRPAAPPGGSASRELVPLRTPTTGRLTSPFGMRVDPVYGGQRLHAGLDVAAAAGTPVRAAADGTVARAGWSGGYGNYTCVEHGKHQGKTLATCYAHQSRILVRAGQRVQRGDLIGRVGTTGASTGNHLHFEVRLNGTPTDPRPYLPACLC